MLLTLPSSLALFYIPKIHLERLYPLGGAAWIGFGASFLFFFYFLGKKVRMV
jgi:hypothetical protein